MNELMQKIAEKLSVSIDKIPEVYEGLKWQYVVWEMCDSISWIFGIVVLCTVPFSGVLILNLFETNLGYQNESDHLKYKKLLKISIWVLIFCISTIAFLQILKYIFAPDIVFLKGVLGGW